MTAPHLVVFFARVGDLVMLTPLLRHLAANGGVELLARPWAASLLRGQPWLGAVHTIDKPNAPAWQDMLTGGSRRRLGRDLAARHFQDVLIFSGEKPVVRRWINGWRGGAALHELPQNTPGSKHMVDVYRRAAAAVGLDSPDFPAAPVLDVPADRLAAMQARLAPLGKRVIAVQAGSSLTHRWFRRQPNLKGLAPQQWGRWLARLMERSHADAVVLLGSRQERREAEAILHATPAAWRNRVHDVTGEVSLGDLPAYLAACHAVLSVDTGPGHIAAAVGTPLLSIFGPTNPDIFAPRGAGRIHVLTGSAPCQFCHWKPEWKTCRANVCLTGLSDDALDNAYAQMMKPE